MFVDGAFHVNSILSLVGLAPLKLDVCETP